jgi:prevent-host-death family protein
LEVTVLEVSIADAHNRLSGLLKKVQKSPITITRRGKPVGVILSPEEYERLRQAEAYSQVLSLSRSLRESGPSASELYNASRGELESGQ